LLTEKPHVPECWFECIEENEQGGERGEGEGGERGLLCLQKKSDVTDVACLADFDLPLGRHTKWLRSVGPQLRGSGTAAARQTSGECGELRPHHGGASAPSPMDRGRGMLVDGSCKSDRQPHSKGTGCSPARGRVGWRWGGGRRGGFFLGGGSFPATYKCASLAIGATNVDLERAGAVTHPKGKCARGGLCHLQARAGRVRLAQGTSH